MGMMKLGKEPMIFHEHLQVPGIFAVTRVVPGFWFDPYPLFGKLTIVWSMHQPTLGNQPRGVKPWGGREQMSNKNCGNSVLQCKYTAGMFTNIQQHMSKITVTTYIFSLHRQLNPCRNSKRKQPSQDVRFDGLWFGCSQQAFYLQDWLLSMVLSTNPWNFVCCLTMSNP